jgi:hypothetical protein
MKRRSAIIVFVIAGMLAGGFAVASARSSEMTRFHTPTDVIGFEWYGDDAAHIVFRAHADGAWTEWLRVEAGESDHRDGDAALVDAGFTMSHPILLPNTTAVQWKADENARNIRVVGLVDRDVPSRTPLQWVFELFSGVAPSIGVADVADDEPPISAPSVIAPRIDPNTPAPPFRIIPRSEWIGQNNELATSRREALWPSEYKEVDQFIIHHTGVALRDTNSDGQLSGADFRLLAQGVYNWQAKTRGWGDVGYQFLVDPFGNVYEGRAGGDGTIGGHTLRSSSCTKYGSAVGYNRGSIGIALLGNYESDTITEAARETIATLIATKAREFIVPPNRSAYFTDRTLPAIIGHKDVSCTACPGAALYGSLTDIRTRATAKYQTLIVDGLTWDADILDVTPSTVSIKEGQSQTVTIRVRNTGNTTWRNYPDTPLYIADGAITSSLASLDTVRLSFVDSAMVRAASLFAGVAPSIGAPPPSAQSAPSQISRPVVITRSSALAPFPHAVVVATQPNVRPGEVATFRLELTPTPGRAQDIKRYVLALGNTGIVPNVALEISVTNLSVGYGAVLEEHTLPDTWLVDGDKTVTVQYKNTGALPWVAGDIVLSLSNADDVSAAPVFMHPAWDGNTIVLAQDVQPGEIGVFTFPITASRLGAVSHELFLTRTVRVGDAVVGEETVPNSVEIVKTVIDSEWKGMIKKHNIPNTFARGVRPRIELTIENTGTHPWFTARGTTKLKITDERGSTSALYDRHDWLDEKVAAWFVGGNVAPNKTSRMRLRLAPQKAPGLHRLRLDLTAGDHPIYLDGKRFSVIQTEVK